MGAMIVGQAWRSVERRLSEGKGVTSQWCVVP